MGLSGLGVLSDQVAVLLETEEVVDERWRSSSSGRQPSSSIRKVRTSPLPTLSWYLVPLHVTTCARL